MQLGKAMEEMLSGSVWTLCGAAVAGKALALGCGGGVAFHVGARAEAPADASQDDHPKIGIIVPRPHVFAHLGYRAILLGGADQGVHAFRTIEFDPQNACVFGFVEQIIDKLRSHAMPPLSGDVFEQSRNVYRASDVG